MEERYVTTYRVVWLIALLNAVYGGASETLELVLDVRQVAAKDKRVLLAQETLLVVACTFEAVATLGEFTSCISPDTQFLPTGTNLNPAATWQMEVDAADLEIYEAAHESFG